MGWPETTVIVRFWILAGLFAALGLGIFYRRFPVSGQSVMKPSVVVEKSQPDGRLHHPRVRVGEAWEMDERVADAGPRAVLSMSGGRRG